MNIFKYLFFIIVLISIPLKSLALYVSPSTNSDYLDGFDSSYYLNSTNQNSGILNTARLSGNYTGITKVGTLSGLNLVGNLFITGNSTIVGTVNITAANANRYAFIVSRTTDRTKPILAISESASNQCSFEIFNSANASQFRINANSNCWINLATGSFGVGTNSPQRKFSVVGDAQVTGNIYESNSAYGGFFVSGNAVATAISSTTALYDVTKNAQSMGLLKNITHTAGVITVGVSGIYMVTVVGNIDQKTAADDIHCFISKNNTNTPSWEYISDSLDSTIATQPIMCQGIFSLAANDTLRLKVQNITGARNVRIENLNFMVRRIAPL